MKKNFIAIVLLVIMVIGVYIYFDGLLLYKIQKKIMPPLGLIEYYIDENLPDETVVNSIKFEADTNPQYSEILIAQLTLPKDAIDTLFCEEERTYNVEDFYLFKQINNQSQLEFRVTRHEGVRRTRFVRHRLIEFSVYETQNDNVDMCIMINCLGYYRL